MNTLKEEKDGIFHPIFLYSQGKGFTEILVYIHFKDKMGLVLTNKIS